MWPVSAAVRRSLPVPTPSLLPLLACACALALGAASGRANPAPEGMVLVPAGPFTMGSDTGSPDEKPQRTVVLPAYYVDRTEVTVEDYARFLRATGRSAPPDWTDGKPDPRRLRYPVTNVSWYDASAYARWMGKRLPTEAEWEKAARGSDGRILPWGNEWDDSRANVEGERGDQPLKPVAAYPGGASPFGALDLLGNAWEWTADYYLPYPGNPVPSVHYGEKYRAVRGGGSINFYNSPPLNTKSAALRARVQPFGRYDSLGFRCVLDPGGLRRDLPEVKAPGEREMPVPPPVETPAEVAARYGSGIPVEVRDTTGVARSGVATFGLPFPQGILRDASRIRTGGPVQARPLATWRDGSVRWVLLDVPATVNAHGSQKLSVRWDGAGSVPQPAKPVVVTEAPDTVTLDTGVASVVVRRRDTRWLTLRSGGETLTGPEELVRVAGEAGGDLLLKMRPPTSVRVEDRGPLRARVRIEGWLVDDREQPVIRYRYRLDARSGSPAVRLVHTFTHLSPRKMLEVHAYDLRFRTEASSLPFFGMDRDAAGGQRLVQLRADEFSIQPARPAPAGTPVARLPRLLGKRAPGWMQVGRDRSTLIAVRHFWQQYPKSLGADGNTAVVGLWAGGEPFEADQGLSKSHELLLAAGPSGLREASLANLNEPLFGVAPPDWYCATQGLGVLAPYSLARYPQFETEVEASSDLMERQRPYGMRHFGDNYFGGPYKGINAYQNLEYDVPYNHLMQFARTGARKYLDRAVVQARHQGDIDIKHDGGPQWKHSPRHTTTEAELGHVFLRGLVAYTWLTGDPEGLENARIIGDWLIKVVANPGSQGNERQIGWGTYALTGIYEATWDPRYLQALKGNIDRLLAGQDALGRFKIRWDNRIAFFYGITLSGWVKYYEATGDERIPESIRRIVTRLHGFYPDYGGRTLEGLAWLYTRTGDPEVRLTCQRAWETTMQWRPLDIGGMTIFTTRFLPSVETLGLACPREWEIPETGPVEDGIRRHHFRAGSGTLYLQGMDRSKPVNLVLLRHVGLAPATVRVTGPGGRVVTARSLPATGDPLQYARLRLPPGGPYRVELREGPDPAGMKPAPEPSPKPQAGPVAAPAPGAERSSGVQKTGTTRAWDLITAQPARRVFHVPDWKDVEALTPRIYFRPMPGAKELRFQLEAEREGFKGAVLYDPEGKVAGVLSRFVDYGDEGCYTYDLVVPLAGRTQKEREALWSLDLQEVSVHGATGVHPYVSTNPEAFFLPGAPPKRSESRIKTR